MLRAPQKYLDTLISNAGIERDITSLILYLITKSDFNLHFIIEEKEIRFADIICKLCLKNKMTLNKQFNFELGQRVTAVRNASNVFEIYGLPPNLVLRNNYLKTKPKLTNINLNKYIPVTNYNVQREFDLQRKIEQFKECFGAEKQSDFFNNEKLLVIGNQNLFKDIPKEFPSCFVHENDNGKIEIEYNSPLLPKICVLKNVNLLSHYLQMEINGKHITFSTCIFFGSSKFEYSINTIRNYYNQRIFSRVIFIGGKDIKMDLGNKQIPLRWKWTIPEINYFKNVQSIKHNFIIIPNIELESAITHFYNMIKEIEIEYTINVHSIFYFIRRLYYDWNLKLDSNSVKLNQISNNFQIALQELLTETFFNIDPDFNFKSIKKSISTKFTEIINTVKSNNKTEYIKTYKTRINQFVVPTVLQNAYLEELKQIKNCNNNKFTKTLNSFLDLGLAINKDTNTQKNYLALVDKDFLTEIISFSKSDDEHKQYHKLMSSVYRFNKIEKLIEKLANTKTQYSFLLYSIEDTLFKAHIDKYVEKLNYEYASKDRYEISGIEFNDNYYQFSTFDDLIESLVSTEYNQGEKEFCKIIFSDNSHVKLPSTKAVLKIDNDEKLIMNVEDLSIGDKVEVYENPDKKTLRLIFELKHPDLIKSADQYSSLWQQCLLEYSTKTIIDELYEQLKKNGFSVSINRLQKYLNKEVEFPRSNRDLIAIAKTTNDKRLSFDLIKTTILPFISDYKGRRIEYGDKFRDSINNYLITGEIDEFTSEWYSKKEVDEIVSQIPIKTIKDIELLTTKNSIDE